MRYYLNENNSGGSFWLTSDQYDGLFNAGWELDQEYINERESDKFYSDDFVGSLSPRRSGKQGVPYSWRSGGVYIEANSMQEAVESFEAATGENFFVQGCNCCGAPFSIVCRDGGSWEYMSGDDARYEAVRPF